MDFVLPVSLVAISEDQGFRAGQMGKQILVYEEDTFPELEAVDLVLVGCGEQRGLGMGRPFCKGTDQIRKMFYRSFYWHTEIRIADIGNIKPGASLSDTYAALNLVIRELTDAGKRVLIIGGSHDLTLAQYHAYAGRQQLIEAVCIDAKIDLDMEALPQADHFLMEMLTGE